MDSSVEYVEWSRLSDESSSALIVLSFGGKLRCLRMPGNRWLKLAFATDDELAALRAAGAKLGIKGEWRPSGWGDLFHDAWGRPQMLPDSTRIALPRSITGAWEEARIPAGSTRHDLKEYDIVGAYGWAGTRELPVVRSACPVSKWSGRGIYLVRDIRAGGVEIPPHLRWNVRRMDSSTWVTSEEMEELDLKCEIVRGVKFASWWEPRARIEAILSAAPRTIAKRILRAYWGTWAAPRGVTSRSTRTGKVWTLDNPWYDPVSAHYIVSRVRNRVAQVAKAAVHVFVDAVITPERLPEGEELGAWKLKNRFTPLFVVRGAGRWEDKGAGLVKQAGTKRKEA